MSGVAISSQIAQILSQRYPCKLAPRGTWRAIAEEVGVSGERVRQVATSEGWVLVKATPPMYRCACGTVQRSAALCSDCRYVELPCEECQKPVRTSAVNLAWRVARHPGSAKYTGRVFCGRPCFGRWAGKNRVGAHRAEKVQRLRARLQELHPSGIVPWGAWRRLSDDLGLDHTWVARQAAELGWRRERIGE